MQSKEQPKADEKLKIKQIRNGIVIDHIANGRALEVLRILGIGEGYGGELSLAMNIQSKKFGKKDIVKVEDRDIKTHEINKIAVIAPKATINVIRDYKVISKEKVELPEKITGIVRCPNPKCISNKEREPVSSCFIVIQRDPATLKCKYCERIVKGL
ncbi:MAG: aspartate carbamoyltransferase regulatory subunit [Candidatus Altiarchaeota archaeon]|nr:aspartate carbamoyltransferase regulatory subunit [Candidatus Altiarchaeota archaeon]